MTVKQQKRLLKVLKYLAYVFIVFIYFGSIPAELNEDNIEFNADRLKSNQHSDYNYFNIIDSTENFFLNKYRGQYNEWTFELSK